ncbi:MAG: DegT/DnrJ/EryC1/StrS family aminotransferase, partial [Halobacteriovoraceae bacterium]|nr:DegT/DnrJ/EryC1/StrS family aminotransferase [Halobacteriovoraceae bacterium]
TSRRDQLFDDLSKNGITPRKHYQRIISQEAIFQEYPAHTPKAERMCKKVISLPLYQELTDGEVEYVASTIKGFFNQVK